MSDREGSDGRGAGQQHSGHELDPQGPHGPLRAGNEPHRRGGGGRERGLGLAAGPTELPAGHPAPEQVSTGPGEGAAVGSVPGLVAAVGAGDRGRRVCGGHAGDRRGTEVS